MLNKELMKYIPREYKSLVADIYEGEDEYDERTNRMNTPIIVEWQNGEISRFQHKTWMRICLKEFHSTDEYTA